MDASRQRGTTTIMMMEVFRLPYNVVQNVLAKLILETSSANGCKGNLHPLLMIAYTHLQFD